MYLDEFELPVAFEYGRVENHVDQDMAFPAWSLSKLINMLPATISQRNRPDLSLEITKDSVYWFIQYTELGYDCKHEVMKKNVLDAVVNMIEWLIKEGYFRERRIKCVRLNSEGRILILKSGCMEIYCNGMSSKRTYLCRYILNMET